jgi:hypothetical protein
VTAGDDETEEGVAGERRSGGAWAANAEIFGRDPALVSLRRGSRDVTTGDGAI